MNRLTLLLLALLFGLTCSAMAQPRLTYSDLHDFGGTVQTSSGILGPDGQNIYSPITFDSVGNMYGTTDNGGPNTTTFGGVLWEITVAGEYFDLHDFGGTIRHADGSSGMDGVCAMGVTIDASGNIFGATTHGGKYNVGMVWELNATGNYYDLHDFGGTVTLSNGASGGDGSLPDSSITMDANGNLYGTTTSGGANLYYGNLYEITKYGQYIDLHDFGGTLIENGTIAIDGNSPEGGVTLDAAGNLYGTTTRGGANYGGMIWMLSANGDYSDLHDFGGTVIRADGTNGTDGNTPYCTLQLDKNGNIYGTAYYGGAYQYGLLWEITAAGQYIDLHDFGGTVLYANGQTGKDGTWPYAAVTIDGDGNLYGTTTGGGAFGNLGYGSTNGGIVWELTTTGTYIDLHDFCGTTIEANGKSGPDGTYLYAGVTLDSIGNIYGGTYDGGASGNGIVWCLSGVAVRGLAVSPTSVVGGNLASGTITLTSPAQLGGQTVSLSSSDSSVVVPASVTIPAGATTAVFPVKTLGVSAQASVTITAGSGTGSQTATVIVQPATLTSITLNPTSVSGGLSSTATISLNGATGPGGLAIQLASSSSYAIVPSTLTVPPGQSSTTFSISTQVVSKIQLATITAQRGGTTFSATLVVALPIPVSISLSPNVVPGGGPTVGTVTLSSVSAKGGLIVNLWSNSDAATTPATVLVAAGKSSASFPITTVGGTSQRTAVIAASVDDAATSATLTVNPIGVGSVMLSPSQLTGGTNATGTITLTGQAPKGGVSIKLFSNSSAATMPTTISIGEGKRSAQFTVKTLALLSQIDALVRVELGSSAQTATLTIKPPVLISVGLSSTSVLGGKSMTGTVKIGSPAPIGGLTISLSSSQSEVTVAPAVTIPAGKTSATFSVATTSVSSKGSAVITAKFGTTSKSASLSIIPN